MSIEKLEILRSELNHKKFLMSSSVIEEILDNIIPLFKDIEEVVHHKNFVRDDNRIENLELFKNDAKHLAYHRELKKISGEEICGLCKWFDSDMIYCEKHPEYGELVEMDTCDDYEELP